MKTKPTTIQLLSIILMIINTLLVVYIGGKPITAESSHIYYVSQHTTTYTIKEDVVPIEGVNLDDIDNPDNYRNVIEAGSEVQIHDFKDENVVCVCNSQYISAEINISDLVDEDAEAVRQEYQKYLDTNAEREAENKAIRRSIKYWYLTPRYLCAGLFLGVFFLLVDLLLYSLLKKERIVFLILNIIMTPGLIVLALKIAQTLTFCK